MKSEEYNFFHHEEIQLGLMFWKEKEEKEKIWKSWFYSFQEEKEEKEK